VRLWSDLLVRTHSGKQTRASMVRVNAAYCAQPTSSKKSSSIRLMT
jgi:hypothetical protein